VPVNKPVEEYGASINRGLAYVEVHSIHSVRGLVWLGTEGMGAQ